MNSNPFGDVIITLYVDFVVCLRDHRWHFQTVTLEWDQWDYENNLDVSYPIEQEAHKLLQLSLQDVKASFLYMIKEKSESMPNYVIDVVLKTRGSFSINAKSEDEAYNWVNNLEDEDLIKRAGLDERTTVDHIYFDINSSCTDEEDRPEDDTIGDEE